MFCARLSVLSAIAGWALLFLASRYASPPYRTQRMVFAWPVPDRAWVSRPGKRSSSRATDDLLYPATARGALCLPSRACCRCLGALVRCRGARAPDWWCVGLLYESRLKKSTVIRYLFAYLSFFCASLMCFVCWEAKNRRRMGCWGVGACPAIHW